MSDPDQRRGGLAERRDSFAQDAAVTSEIRGSDPAHEAARPAVGAAAGVRKHAGGSALLQGGGEMGERIRAHDWAATPLGPIEHWPPCLRNTLQTILQSPMPMNISWGERGILLYNDAMIPVLCAHHPQALGLGTAEGWPEHASWNERVLRQVLAGESVSLHNQRLETRRSGIREQSWFDLDYSPILDEDGHACGMLSVVVETTAQVAALAERERLDASLRESEARQRFVLAFNDRVRGLSDPDTAMTEAVTALGEHLQVARCGYAEVSLDMQQLDIKAEWTDERQASTLGTQALAEPSEAVRATFLAGKTFVVRDARNDAREKVRARAASYQAWGARALIGVPLIHNGRWVALLYVADLAPRAWSPAEIGLIEEMAARVWEAVERARAEMALRENEARLRALFEAVPSAVFVCDRDAVIQAYNARAVELWGRAPLRGMEKRGAVRAWSVEGRELTHSPVEEVLETGRAQQIELTIDRPDGVRLPVLADYSPLRNTHGEVTGVIVAFSDISERKRRESELALLADIGEATAHCDDEAQIMQAVSSRIGSHMGLHCCCLISVDEAQQNAVVDQVWYEGQIPNLPRRAPLSDFVIPAFAEEARSGKPIVVNDCHADPRTDGDAYARYEVGSYISVPWHENGDWSGLLAFCDDQPRVWKEHEVQLARELSGRIMPRLQRARAQAALRESRRQLAGQVSDLERLHALGTRLMKQDDLRSVLCEVMNAASELLHADKATVQVCEQDRLELIGAIGFPETLLDSFRSIRADGVTTCAAALRRRERVVVEDLKHDAGFSELSELAAKAAVRGAISTPLLAEDGSVTAVFTVYFSQPWKTHAPSLRMLDLYTQQAVVQIQRVRSSKDAARLAAIVTSSHDAIISKDLNGVITSWNYGAELLFGYTAEEVIGKSVTILMPLDRVDEEPAILARIRAGEVVDHYETVRQRKDGSPLNISLTVAPIRDSHGRVIGASKIARDVTARVRSERDAAWLAAIVTSSHDAIISKDLDGIITTWNHGAEWLFGYTAEEAIGHPITMLAPPERKDEEPNLTARIRGGEVVDHFETVRVRKDGTLLDVSLTIAPIRDARGQIVGASKIARDVTARKRAQSDAARLAAIVMSTHDAVYSEDLNGTINTWNHGAELLLGYTAAEAIGQPVAMLLPEGREGEVDGMLARIRAGEVMNHFETVRQRKDGALLNVSLTVAPIYDGEGRIIGASKIAHDITARVQAELGHLGSLIRERNAREEAEILVESARLLSSQIDQEQLAQKLTDLATRLTGAQYGAFFQGMAGDRGEPGATYTYTLSGTDKAAFAHLPLPVESPLFHPTFRDGQVVRCSDVRKHPEFGKGKFHGLPPGHPPVRSFLAVPVVSRSGKVHGGLFFAHALYNVFDERAERLVQGIAAQAAIALDNAQIYRDMAESEARFRQMIDALPMPVYTTDPEGVLTHFNPASVEFAGRTPEVGKDAWCVSWKLYRADGSFLPHDQCPMAIALKQNRPIFGGIEAIAERPDGTRRWFTPYPTPLHDAHGHLVGGINMLVDITERKRQEQALVEAHGHTEGMRRLYEAILDNTPDLAFIFDLDHRFTYANVTLLEMLGRTWDEVIGKNPLEIGYPDWQVEMHDREMEQVVATKLPVRGQVPFTGAFGERIYDYIFVPVIGPHGEVEAIAGTTRDVTDQKEIERNLRADEERKTLLLALGDRLRGLQDPGDVQYAACELLAERLGCDRVYFVEISESEDRAFVLPDYRRPDLPSVAGEYDLAGMEDLLTDLREGRPLVVDDTAQAPLPQTTRAMMQSLGLRALTGTILVKRDKLAWALLAAHSQPREWKPDEIALMAEVAERTWDAVQRAQAINALREAHGQAEQHARTLDSTMSSVLDMVFRFTPEGRIDYANQALLDVWGVSREQAFGKSMAELGYARETEQRISRDLMRVAETGAPVENETAYTNPAGVHGYFTYKLAPIFDAEGKVKLIAGTALDISDRKRNEMLLAEQKNVLELAATGCELSHCLEELTSSVRRLDEHTRAAVLLVGGTGKSFEEVHSANLPACFGENVRGAPIGRPATGTCGRAVFEGVPVTCPDIAQAEQWALEWRDLCVGEGLRACHSVPIFDPHGKAIGSFFLAFDRPGEPDEWHRRIAQFGAHVASIAIANKRAEAAVRESEAELAQELADTRLLQGVSTELLSETNPDALYSRIVDAAAALMRSDAATLQMFHPERGQGELRLLAYRGFSDESARQREWIQVGSDTASGMVLQRGKRIIVKDVRECAAVWGEEGVAHYERSGLRAVQSTPLFSRNGKLVGVLSTHWREPQEPSARRLGLLEVLGRQAADLIEGRRAEQKLLELNNFLERRVAERTIELVESERRVRDMASQLTMAEHAERRRISQILHDDLQQQLHSIQMKLASARNALGRGNEARTLRHLTDAEQWSGEGVETARRLTVDLSPPILKSEGLAEALDWLVTQMREMHGLHVVVSGDRDLRMHDDAKRVLIYQIVRELLFNIVKHAGTDKARIELRRQEDVLDVCVLDEGKGFDPEKLRKGGPRKAGGFGLTSAHERLSLLGGGIEVDSAPGIGTAIVLHVPLRRASGDEAAECKDAEGSATEDLFD